MTEKDIKICGHGSGYPSTKNMYTYCKIYVPYSANHSILASYQSAQNLSTHASKMVEEPAP